MPLNPDAPYEITFKTDPPPRPSEIDHTESNPGPSNGKRRAGYTTFTLDAKMTVARRVEPGPPAVVYFDSVTIEFILKDFTIYISSDYSVESCPYRATCEHELASHVRRPIRLFLDRRDAVVQRFAAFPQPTQAAPRRISIGQEDEVQARAIQPVYELIKTIKAEIKTLLENDRVVQDDGAHYQTVYTKCRPEDWQKTG